MRDTIFLKYFNLQTLIKIKRLKKLSKEFKFFKIEKKVLLIFFFNFCVVNLYAQQDDIEIRGFVIDLATKQPIHFATILVGEKDTLQPLTLGQQHWMTDPLQSYLPLKTFMLRSVL